MVIWKDDEMFGFIEDIIEELKTQRDAGRTSEGWDDDDEKLWQDALDQAETIRDEADYPEPIYRVFLHPMGAFVFVKQIDAE